MRVTHVTKGLLSNQEHFIQQLDKIDRSMEDRTGPNVRWLLEHADDTKLRIHDPEFSMGIPTLSQSLCDFEEGLAVFLGQPNSGKSTLMVNMQMQALSLNEDLIIADFTLDDPRKKRYQQQLACLTGLRYQQISIPASLDDEQKQKLQTAKNYLRDLMVQRKLFSWESSEDIKDSTIMVGNFEAVFSLMKDFRKEFPNNKIAFFVDAWNNLDYSGGTNRNDLNQLDAQLKALAEASKKYHIMGIVSAHSRKATSRRITLEDIRGTKTMEYHIVFGGIVRNEYKENALLDPLMYEKDDRLYPILTLEVAKQKSSEWDNPLFYALYSNRCQLGSLTREEYLSIYKKYQNSRRT